MNNNRLSMNINIITVKFDNFSDAATIGEVETDSNIVAYMSYIIKSPLFLKLLLIDFFKKTFSQSEPMRQNKKHP